MEFEKKILQLDSIRQKLFEMKDSSHAILIASPDKILRDNFAKLLIMQEVCSNEQKPCFLCPSCKKVVDSNAVDVEVFGTGKQILVGDSAKIVADSFVVPLEFEKKYFVLTDFENATEQAQNKLLKVIEEPQRFDKFVFLTGNLAPILPTIKSRTEMFFLPQLSTKELMRVFDDFGDKSKLSKAIEDADGSITRCQQILDDQDYAKMFDLATRLITSMQSTAVMIDYSNEILSFKGKLSQFLKILLSLFVDLLAQKFGRETKHVEIKSQFEIVSHQYSTLALTKIIEQINNANAKLKVNLSQSEIVDNLLLKILEIKYICK